MSVAVKATTFSGFSHCMKNRRWGHNLFMCPAPAWQQTVANANAFQLWQCSSRDPGGLPFLHCSSNFKSQSYFGRDVIKQYVKTLKEGVGVRRGHGDRLVRFAFGYSLPPNSDTRQTSLRLYWQDPKFLGPNYWVRNSCASEETGLEVILFNGLSTHLMTRDPATGCEGPQEDLSSVCGLCWAEIHKRPGQETSVSRQAAYNNVGSV